MALTNAERQARYRARRQGRRVPDPVPAASGPKIAAAAVGRRGADAPGAAGPVPGRGVTRCRNRSSGRRPRRCSRRSAIWIYRCWRLSSCPGASGVTGRPPAPASAWRHESKPGAGIWGCTASSSGGRDGVAAGREACQRAARVLRDATALSGDTPPAPRLGWQLWALRPGLDGASRPSTTNSSAAANGQDSSVRRTRARRPRGARGAVGGRPRNPSLWSYIRRFFGGQFWVSPGGQF